MKYEKPITYVLGKSFTIRKEWSEAMISGRRWLNESHEFLKKAWNPPLCIGALPFLPIFGLGGAKKSIFWRYEKFGPNHHGKFWL